MRAFKREGGEFEGPFVHGLEGFMMAGVGYANFGAKVRVALKSTAGPRTAVYFGCYIG